MKLLLLSLILNLTTACSQTNSKTQDTMEIDTNKSQVLDVTRQVTQLMIERNTAAIAKIVDEILHSLISLDISNAKKIGLAEVERESMKYYSFKEVKHETKDQYNNLS